MFSSMLMKPFYILLFLPIFDAQSLNQKNGLLEGFSKKHIHTEVTEGVFGERYEFKVNSLIEYSYEYLNVSEWFYSRTPRVSVESISANESFPVLVVVRQQKGVLSWQLPLTVGPHSDVYDTYTKVSRTLCPSMYHLVNGRLPDLNEEERVIVTISTSSQIDVDVTLSVNLVDDFYINLSEEKKNITTSPSEPQFYGYRFPNHTDTVFLSVESQDELCTTVSVQSIDCPIYDLERNVEFEGRFETMTYKGGMTIKRKSYPMGFYVVFVVKGDDMECTGEEGGKKRSKTLSFVLNPGFPVDYHLWAILGIPAIFIICSTFFCVWTCYKKRCCYQSVQSDDNGAHEPGVQPVENNADDPTTVSQPQPCDDNGAKTPLYVSALARENYEDREIKSEQYVWTVVTVGVFYALPVAQLVATHQIELHQTGNQDICFYNFHCAYQFGWLSDLNHVISNIGYVILGILFMSITYIYKGNYKKSQELSDKHDIPKHFGLYYAMGGALIMEGVLSGAYHVCPSQSNFQFDTSFMYVISVLCIVKIYQNRHPDINARACVTFAALAGVTIIGMWGVIGSSLGFWITFTLLHVGTCLVMTGKIYHMRNYLTELKRLCFTKCSQSTSPRMTPNSPKCTMGYQVIVIICNILLAIYGIFKNFDDFATQLLYIFLTNLILYCLYYIYMKVANKMQNNFKECMKCIIVFYKWNTYIPWDTIAYIMLSCLAWGFALYYFKKISSLWKMSPAQSRTYNRSCVVLDFFDYHDVWHFLSAISMFLSFMVLLTIDDDLIKTERNKILVI